MADRRPPPIISAYVERATADRPEPPAAVRLRQQGEMWLKPGAAPRPFTAVQEIAVREVGFAWRATFPLAPLLGLRVVDRFGAGEGSLEVRLLGIRVLRQSGWETSIGEAIRYLAELPWAPFAMTVNPDLEWLLLDELVVEVATRVQGVRAAVTLLFDASGDITGARCADRPFPRGKTFVPMPWAGSFTDHAVVGGVRIPRRGEVRWELPQGPYTYWRGAVVQLDCDAPQ